MRTYQIGCLALAIIAGPTAANAADGDSYHCTVRDFINATGTGKADFTKANREKVFQVNEFADKFTIEVTSKDFRPYSDEYMITSRSILQTTAINAKRSIGSNTFIISSETDSGEPLSASVVFQAHDIANVWFLTCLPK